MGRATGVVKDQSQGVKMIVSSMYTVHCSHLLQLFLAFALLFTKSFVLLFGCRKYPFHSSHRTLSSSIPNENHWK